MKQQVKKFSILTLALICGSTMTACTSAKSGGSNSSENVSTGTAQNEAATESNQSSSIKTTTATPAKQADIFAAFKSGQDYKTAVRPKIVKDGWQPARSADGEENCQSGMEICKEYPELDGGPAARMGNIVFRWKKGDKVLLVHTVDDPPVYESYEFEKQAKPSNPSDFTGKYSLAVVGISGEHTLELKNDKTATLKILEEDGESTGTGSWSWDEAKRLLTVTLSVKYEIAGSDVTEKKPATSKAIFQFMREGKNLKIVNQTLAPDVSYSGNVFKKI